MHTPMHIDHCVFDNVHIIMKLNVLRVASSINILDYVNVRSLYVV